jgi:hypothetical protein
VQSLTHRRLVPKHLVLACCLIAAALAPAARPVLAGGADGRVAARSDIAVHLTFTGGDHYVTTLADAFVTPTNQSIANDSCGVWYKDAKHMYFELSVRFDQIQIYSSPIAAGGLRLLVGGYKPNVSSYTDNGANALMLRAQNHSYDVDLLKADSVVHARILNGGHSGSFTATHYSQSGGPATITIQGTWTCSRLFKLKAS